MLKKKTIIFVCFILFFQCFILVPNVSAPEIIKPFDYVTTYVPPNSFGASEFTDQYVNWSWVNDHVTYSLKRDGVDVTNSLVVNFSTVFTDRKYSYSFTAGEKGYFLFTLTFDSKAVSSHIDDVNHTVYFDYSDGQLFYNFTDIYNINQIDKSFNLNNNVFIMTVGKNVNKNVNVVLDPTFGITGDAANIDLVTAANVEYLHAYSVAPTGAGYANNITIKTGTVLAVACKLHCALYFSSNGSLLAQTETKSVSAVNTVSASL